MPRQQPVECRAVTDVELLEHDRAADDLLDPLDRARRAVAEVVDADGVMAGGQQFDQRVRADVAGRTGDQHGAGGWVGA